jgi:ADP-ribose pyrophosphatase
MSSEAQKPKIINREELKTEAKWLKMEKINWKDQDGKKVALSSLKEVVSS